MINFSQFGQRVVTLDGLLNNHNYFFRKDVMGKKTIVIPEPVLRRLPLYYHLFKRLSESGYEKISCTLIGKELDLAPPQIRKDLAYTGIRGVPKVGYEVLELIEFIEQFLGWNKLDEAFLAGTGNLGKALLNYKGFDKYKFKIVAAFDVDPALIGKSFASIDVLHIDKLGELAQRMGVKTGIITVNQNAAQMVADLMVAGGMKGIWNFAPVNLKTPDDVIVQNENLVSGLSVLTKKMQLNNRTGEIK